MAWPLWGVSVGQKGGVKERGVVRVAVDAAGAADVDDVSWFAVFDSEVGRCGSDKSEGGGVVEGEDCVPLLVCHLDSSPHQPSFASWLSHITHGSIRSKT